MPILGKMTAEGARARLAMEQPEYVARHLVEPSAVRKLRLATRHEGVEPVEPGRRGLIRAEQCAVHLGEKIRIGIGGAAEHDAIDIRQMRLRCSQRLDTAGEADVQRGGS